MNAVGCRTRAGTNSVWTVMRLVSSVLVAYVAHICWYNRSCLKKDGEEDLRLDTVIAVAKLEVEEKMGGK